MCVILTLNGKAHVSLHRPSKDPRFDATIGGKQFNKDAFAKRYSFLYEDVIPQDRAKLKEQLKVSTVFDEYVLLVVIIVIILRLLMRSYGYQAAAVDSGLLLQQQQQYYPLACHRTGLEQQ